MARPAQGTGAGVGVQRREVAGTTVPAGAGVAHVGHRGLAQGVGEPHWAGAGEGGGLVGELSHNAGSSILAFLFSSIARVSVLTIFSNIVWGALAICFSSRVYLAG